MTAQFELERILDDFLGEGTDELSADVLEAALLDVRYTDQRRAHPVPRRTDDVSPPLRLLAVAAILVAAVGGAVMLGNSIRNDATPTPALTPMPNANPLPSAADDGPIAIGANVHGRWTASRPAAFASPAGDYDLDFPDDGALTATARNGEVRRLDLIPDLSEAGQLKLSGTQGCQDKATYEYTLARDFRTLHFEKVDDACADRSALLAGDWSRSVIEHHLDVDQPYVFGTNPRLTFSIPAGFAQTHVPLLHSIADAGDNELWVDAGDSVVLLQTGGQVQRDRCDRNAGFRDSPTTFDEFVEWNQAATGVNLTAPVDTTVGGHPAVFVDIGGTDDCPNGPVPADCSCVEATVLSDVDGTLYERAWAVDVNGKIVIVLFHDGYAPLQELTPERLALAQEFIDSIQFE
jgi:hypothetical protein